MEEQGFGGRKGERPPLSPLRGPYGTICRQVRQEGYASVACLSGKSLFLCPSSFREQGGRPGCDGLGGVTPFHTLSSALCTRPPQPEVRDGAGRVVGAPRAEDIARNSVQGRC